MTPIPPTTLQICQETTGLELIYFLQNRLSIDYDHAPVENTEFFYETGTIQVTH